MDLLGDANSFEKNLQSKADAQFLPLSCGIELLPLCNLDCNMCYVRHSPSELEQPLLGGSDWLRIMEAARDAGTLFVCMTGGEALLHPDFKEIYLGLQQMGFLITVNTNGTLIDEKWADFFATHRCKRFNISLYGASDETYKRLCHSFNGFTRVSRAFELLKERDIVCKLNFTMTKENRNDIEQMVKIAYEYDWVFVPTCYTLPPTRKATGENNFYQSRMTPEEAAETKLKILFLQNPDRDRQSIVRGVLDLLRIPTANMAAPKGFHCHAARSDYWISWKGDMIACGSMNSCHVNLKEKGFIQAWQELISQGREIPVCNECIYCGLKPFCQSCPSACIGETGKTDGKPQYLCDMTVSFLHQMITELPSEEQGFYSDLLDKRIPT